MEAITQNRSSPKKFFVCFAIFLTLFVNGLFLNAHAVSPNIEREALTALYNGTNGDNWHWRNPLPQGNPLYGIVYVNNSFIVVGDAGTILTSTDNGVTWTSRDSGTAAGLRGVAYGNNTFVAVGKDGIIVASTNNGVTWTSRDSGTIMYLYAVGNGNNTFVAMGALGTILQSDSIEPNSHTTKAMPWIPLLLIDE